MATLQVSDLRQELLRATRECPDSDADAGNPTTRSLGSLLHRIFAALIGDDDSINLNAALSAADNNVKAWQSAIADHAYQHIAGPELLRQRAALQDSSQQVLNFWTACEELCNWLGELLWTIREEGDAVGVSGHQNVEATLRGSRQLWPHPLVEVIAEQRHSLTLHEADWLGPVTITGIPDAVFYLRGRRQWCVVELKSGRTAPEADLLQACLYHRMLCDEQQDQPAAGQLALISFLPERREQLFSAEELRGAQARITELAGQMAGVLPEADHVVETEVHNTVSGDDTSTEGSPAPQPASAVKATSPAPAKLTQTAAAEHKELADRMLQAFREYNADVTLDGDLIVGPTFLRFPVQLGRGVRMSAVKNRAAEVQVRLGLDRPPLIGQYFGQVVIDVQRPDREFIAFSQIRDQLDAPGSRAGAARVPIGVDLNGELQCADLSQTEHTHILVAGTAGSGKSEWLRSAIAGLIVSNTPDTLRLVLIDPKRNAFHGLRESPYLLRPLVFPDEHDVIQVLASLADEMDRRYRLFEGHDSLQDYLVRTEAAMPRIVCVCDEYFDLVNRDRAERAEIESQIFRLGAKARAAGIHLIIATQQPSRQTIKGALDTNIPARVGLKLSNAIESRMLLGTSGAEQLLNHGDLLFKDIGDPQTFAGSVDPARRT
jgi:S-DNA-T family DNA segregation ATPase FtsK/SpoIIIE